MIKKSLIAKVFFIIVLIFTVQGIVTFSFQKFFLAGFYEQEKSTEMNEIFDNTIENFKNASDLKKQKEVLDEYMDESNEPIIVTDSYDVMHEASLTINYERAIVVKVSNEQLLTIPLEELYDDEYIDYKSIGDEITVYYYKEYDYIDPYAFEYDSTFYELYLSDELEDYESDEMDSFIKKGTIVDYFENDISTNMISKISILEDSIYDDMESDLYTYLSKRVQIHGEKYYFKSLISLQPINEVLAIINKFQVYILLLTIVIIGVSAYFISKLIAKPIIKISQAASSIAELDFDVVCDEKRSDEIGVLAKNLNYLSSSLKDKIDNLNDVNETLEGEIEFERKQELIRKEFVANVSHELKTPLGVISSYSEGIKDGISKENEHLYLDVIIKEVDKMNDLIIDMLELSNLETHQKVSLEEISLGRLIRNNLRPFDVEIKDRGIELHLELDECLVDIDIKKAELLFTNLISNAFRYVDDKKIIKISLIKKVSNTVFKIENSCSQLSEENLEKLFDRFYRVEQSRSRSFGGNGLGLSIVKNILEIHGYNFSVKNTDLGICFEIIF